MIKIVFIALIFILSCNCSDSIYLKKLFEDFKSQFGKIYETEALEAQKLLNFKENIIKIAKLNSEDLGTAEYGITEFTDLTTSEFRQRYLLQKQQVFDFPESRYKKFNLTKYDIPDSFDWRDGGAVTEVKNQGSVGTCWAFSTVGNVEGQWFLKHKELTSLSPEQISDCASLVDPPNALCGVFGGWPYLAMQYITNVGGLAAESDYPYCCGTGKCFPCSPPGFNKTLCGPPVPGCNSTQWPCRDKTVTKVANIKSWFAVSKDEDTIAQSLYVTGPLSIALDASYLQFYRKGVSSPPLCSKTELDHAVLLVGYGTEQSVMKGQVPFWTVKNSWGEKWGEHGYFRMKRGSGTCGINTQVISGVASDSLNNQKGQVEQKEIKLKFEETD